MSSSRHYRSRRKLASVRDRTTSRVWPRKQEYPGSPSALARKQFFPPSSSHWHLRIWLTVRLISQQQCLPSLGCRREVIACPILIIISSNAATNHNPLGSNSLPAEWSVLAKPPLIIKAMQGLEVSSSHNSLQTCKDICYLIYRLQ